MNRPKLLCAIACVWASAGLALGQYGQIAPGLRSAPAGNVGATVPSLFSAGVNGATAGPPQVAPSPVGPPSYASAVPPGYASVAPPPGNSSAVWPPAVWPPAVWPPATWTPSASRPAHPAVVRVVAPGRGSISYGSGSLVAVNEQHGLVITNWHVINEAAGQITVEFPDGFESPATIQKVDRDWDLAALAIWRPQAAPVPLAQQAPRPGELLTIAGYGPGKYRAVSGPCTQYVAPGEKFPFEMVELAAAARQGDSGGPILNSRGELAGVLFGEGQGRTAGSYCGRVHWFLDSVMGRPASESAGQAMIAQTPIHGQPIRGPLTKVPSGANFTANGPPPSQSLPPSGEVWPPHHEVWPPRGESLPVAASSPGLASVAQPWRSSADLEYQTPNGGAATAANSRPPQVASVGKRTADQDVEAAGLPAGVTAAQESAAAGESQVSNGRWEQIKAFCGVVAAIGLLLLVIRSLAAGGVAPDDKPQAAK